MYHAKCSLIDEQGNCRILNQPAAENCRCPFYTSIEPDKCAVCGKPTLKMPLVQMIDDKYQFICGDCYSKLDTCAACTNMSYCAFQEDPSPIPQVVMQTRQQGPMVVQQQVPNPERINITCKLCGCWNGEESYCRRQEGYCDKYTEVELC